MFYLFVILCFFFKQKTAYEVRISDWSSDVCSSDLADRVADPGVADRAHDMRQRLVRAGERFGSRGEERRTTRGQLGTAGDQYFTAGAENRLRAIGADRARRDEQIEEGADAERADQAYRPVALRVLRLLGRGRDGVEADIGADDDR